MLQLLISLLSRFICLSMKLNTGGSFPPQLSEEEERDCLTRLAAGDKSARDKLIEHNLRLVAHVIKKYYTVSNDQEDLISIGVIGLIKAINTYRTDKNTRLATYAARCIENEIFMHFRTVKRMQSELSFSEPIETDCEGNPLTIRDILKNDEDMLEDLISNEKVRQLYRCVDEKLDPREREIIIHRYGLYNRKPLTQRETAEILCISRSYISRIEKAAIEKLKREFDKSDRETA